ncbi:transcriptional initiation protein Tat [Haloferax sp. S1W]|uniref:transcriptional initiation protein Tat n=1 Tax=Haloferax sp. S1W TaxID=3377110 RepID=UPI0037C9CD1C
MSPDDSPSTPSHSTSPTDDQPSLLSRRQLLGLLGGGGAALAGIGWFAPTWLPDPVTDTLTTLYPDPSSNYVWRPPVSDDHVDEAAAVLEDAAEQANELRSRIDLDSVDEDLEHYLRSDPAGGYLDAAKDDDDNRDRLYHARTGLQFVGESIGAAKVVLDEVDPEAVVERGRKLRQTIDDIADSISEYRVSDAGRDLGYLSAIERRLMFSRLESHKGGIFMGGTVDASEYSARDIASTWGSHLQAEQSIRTARHFQDQYRSNLGSQPTSHRSSIRNALDDFLAEIEQYPTRSEVRVQIQDEDNGNTPYGVARWELHTLCYDNDFRVFKNSPDHDLLALRLVDTGRALLERRAHDFALSELDVEPGDTDYDSGRSFRAKRRAMRQFRTTRDEYDSNFAGVVANEAASFIRGGDVGLEIGDGPAWRDRVKSSVYSLVGEGIMRNLGTVVEPLEQG